MRRLVVTADDFGASVAVNAAVERAHRDGILTAASLMVAGDAAADAVARAHALPSLGVGLHLVLVEGRPVLPPGQVPSLVDGSGRFRTDMARAGVTIFASPAARRQLAAEIDAQFAAFAATGLRLDHVNAHKHFHLHPTIASAILRIGPRYGMRAMRAPVEPRRVIAAVEPGTRGFDVAGPWARLLQGRLRRAGLLVPDQVFGLAWSGGFDTARLRALLPRIPDGLTELYFHPADDDVYPGHAPDYRYRAERDALVNGEVAALAAPIQRGSFARFSAASG